MEEQETIVKDASLETIEKTIEINDIDRRKAMFYNVFFRKKWMPFYLGAFLIFSVGVLFCGLTGIYKMPTLLMICAGGLLLLLGMFIVSMVLTSKGPKSQRKLIFTKTGITTSAGRDNKMLSFAWKDMYYLGKTRNYFYIYVDASQFIIVPKRCYSKEEVAKILRYFA